MKIQAGMILGRKWWHEEEWVSVVRRRQGENSMWVTIWKTRNAKQVIRASGCSDKEF